MKALVAGSFDPVTLGHIDLIRRAASFADEVVVAVANNPHKNYWFSLSERKQLLVDAIAETGSAESIEIMELPQGLLVDFAKQQEVNVIVKGIRNAQDLAYEDPMARINSELADIETVFLLANASLQHISSSMVKELNNLKVDIDKMVPPSVARALKEEKN